MGRLPRIRYAVAALGVVLTVGTAGYMMLGFGLLDALYQTVTTVTTVGFREVQPLDRRGQVFTIVLILVGVGTALYTFGVVLEALIEGDLQTHVGRRRMDRAISRTDGPHHRLRAGAGSERRAASTSAAPALTIVVVDRDPARLDGVASRAWSATSPTTTCSPRPGSTAPAR